MVTKKSYRVQRVKLQHVEIYSRSICITAIAMLHAVTRDVLSGVCCLRQFKNIPTPSDLHLIPDGTSISLGFPQIT
jgi:hypothetical protein